MKKKVTSMVLIFSLFFSLFVQSIIPQASYAEGATNDSLLLNPGFESPAVDNSIVGWDVQAGLEGNGNVELSTDYARTGTQSLKFEDTSNASDGSFQVLSNSINIQPKATVTFSVYVYKENSADQSHGIQPVIHYYNEAGNPIPPNSFENYGSSQVPAGAWHELTVTAVAPENAASIKVGLYSGFISLTKVYADDAHVSIVAPSPTPTPTPTPTPEPSPTEPTAPTAPLPALINTGFEDGLNGDNIPGWGIEVGNEANGSLTISEAYARTGSKSLLFQDTKSATSGARFRMLSDAIAATPKETVMFEIFVYKEKAADQSHGIQPVIHYYDAEGKSTKTNDFVNYGAAAVPVGSWHKLTVTGVVPENTAYIKVGLYSGDPSLTKVYADDALLTIAPAYHDSIFNAGFEEATVNGEVPGWSLAPGTEGLVERNEDIVKSGIASLLFKDSNTTKNTRVLSELFAVEGGKTHITEANVYVISQSHNIVLETYYYNALGAEIDFQQALFSGNTLGSNKWSVMKLQTDAPAGAVSARIGLNSGEISLTEAYFDDISIVSLAEEEPLNRQFQAPENLGDMVYVNLGQAAAIQTNADGVNEAYFITNGDPGSFFAVELETGKLLFSEVIPNTEATWAITIGEDKNVYFSGTGDGVLNRYIPTEKRIEKLGYNTADNWVWDLEIIGDKVYGGTYHPQTDGKVFEYDLTTKQFRNYGVVETGQNYVRGIGVDEDYIYAGLGTTIQLFKIDRATGEKTEIIVPGYSGQPGTAGDVYLIQDKIFFSSSTQNMVVLDKNTLEIDATFLHQAMISEPDPSNPNMIYYVYQKKLYQYDIEQKQSTLVELQVDLPDTPRYKDFAWVTLSSGEKANKTVLSAITQYGETLLIDIESGWVKFVELEIASNSVSIQSLENGPDGRLYMGGYQRGMSVYNPFTKQIDVSIANFAQPEGIGFLNDYVYYGTYVGSVIYKFDPKLPAEFNVNPEKVFDVEHQDRPFALTSGDDKMFIGNVPDYGFLGGALAIYDEKLNTWSQFDHELFAKNQSVMSLAYKDGYLFGGTTVWGGLGINPVEDEAIIFVWDVNTNSLVKQIKLSELNLNIDETPRMIGSISFGPDGLLWGVVDGTIFALNVDDLNNIKIEKSKMLFPSLYNSSKWLEYELEWAPDGMIYTTLARKLIAIDPESLRFKVIDDTFTNEMAIGIDGSIYYAPGAKTYLYRIAVPETDATLSAILVNGEPISDFSPGVLSYKVTTSESLNVGATAKQSGATTEVTYDGNTAIIAVTATDGKSKLEYHVAAIAGEPTPTPTPEPEPTPEPTPSPAPNPSPGEATDHENNVLEISIEDLVTNNGEVVIEIPEGISEIMIPAQVARQITEDMTIQHNAISITLLADAIADMASDRNGALSININEAAVNSQALSSSYAAQINQASAPAAISLERIGANDTRMPLTSFAGVNITFNIQDGVDEEHVAIYRILDDGTLAYIGGEIIDGEISANITASGTYVALSFNKQFVDVGTEHWAHSAISAAARMLIAEGINAEQFAPNADITRAEFTALLVRTLGLTGKGAASTFNDVASTSWYAPYISSALEAGLISGRSESEFDPAGLISREEMAALLVRAYQYKHGEVEFDAHAPFNDAEQIKEWARQYVATASKLGLVSGMGNNEYSPQNDLSRAQSIQGIMNLLSK